jgi:hypothetical protein
VRTRRRLLLTHVRDNTTSQSALGLGPDSQEPFARDLVARRPIPLLLARKACRPTWPRRWLTETGQAQFRFVKGHRAFVLTIWQVFEAVIGREAAGRDDRWRHRATSIGRAIVYLALGVLAIRIVVDLRRSFA